MKLEYRLKLNAGEHIELTKEFKAGHLGQKERYNYDILDSNNLKVGEVIYKEDSETTGRCKTTYSLIKYDLDGNVVLSDSWE